MSYLPPQLDFTVTARFDSDAGVWCGQCPEIGVFAEGHDLNGLIAACRELVPYMLPDYGYVVPANVRLTFSVEDSPYPYSPCEASVHA